MEISKGSALPFGTAQKEDGVNFAVYVKDAEALLLCLFDEKNLAQPFVEIHFDKTKNKTGEVWHALVKGLPPVFAYAYRVIPKGQPDVSHLILDPYATCIAGDPNWHDHPEEKAVYRPLGKYISGHRFDWEGDTFPNIPMQDLVIYEMHVRGFTKHASSQVGHPGTYKGVIEKIPYLLDLGVNAVELMPIHEFNEQEALNVNPQTKQKLHNYFGYSTVNFFSPMTRFASNSEADQAIIEFKEMVKALHKNGIEVILDVVFNHTFEGNEKGPVISFKGLDPHAYYMINGNGEYLNFSGCGNTFNCNHPVTRELILSSLRYWVQEMHVDGFRFDLATILNRAANGASLDNAPIVEAISADPVLASTKLIAEAWDPGGFYQVGSFAAHTKRWSDWNGKYRDDVRSFIKGTPSKKNAFAGAISASHDLYSSRFPFSSINFITAHDGFSLADLVSYNEKHNSENDEDNRDGLSQNESWNCGIEGPTDNKKVLNLRKKQMRNFHLALMISQGVPMVLMGDEYGHTRKGNNNTWCQDNDLNWFQWNNLKEQADFYRFYRALIHFRKNHPLLRRTTFFGEKDVQWHGLNPNEPNWEHNDHFIALTLFYPDEKPGLYIAFNASHVYHNINLPSPGEGKAWQWVVNTGNASPEDFFDSSLIRKLTENKYRISPYSSIVLQNSAL